MIDENGNLTLGWVFTEDVIANLKNEKHNYKSTLTAWWCWFHNDSDEVLEALMLKPVAATYYSTLEIYINKSGRKPKAFVLTPPTEAQWKRKLWQNK